VRLSYLDVPLATPGPAAVVLHREGVNSTAEAVAFATGSGLFSRVAAPTGEYAFYPSGMTVGGTCWYRILPGFEGTDPISLTTAVVEVADLLADLALERPVLVGWGQGAVVALAAGLWQPDAVGSVVCVDARMAHIELLPSAVFDGTHHPPVLLAATEAGRAPELAREAELLAGHNIVSAIWCWPGEGDRADLDQALADRMGRWLDDE
jgi:pimeloyl-ACP methyl ester carboxylesterase